MKDLTPALECARKAEEESIAQYRVQAVYAAHMCCIESTEEEWLPAPHGLRLPLQPDVWFFYATETTYMPSSVGMDLTDMGSLYLQRNKRNARVKGRGVQQSWAKMYNASSLTDQLKAWGFV